MLWVREQNTADSDLLETSPSHGSVTVLNLVALSQAVWGLGCTIESCLLEGAWMSHKNSHSHTEFGRRPSNGMSKRTEISRENFRGH